MQGPECNHLRFISRSEVKLADELARRKGQNRARAEWKRLVYLDPD